jgi:hypothetical protein
MQAPVASGSYTPRQPFLLCPPRTWRVLALILAIVALSLGDLYMTLTYLKSGGMGEANPVARWVINHGSPGLLVFWKVATVAVASLILFYARRRASAEVAAWGCCFVLTWLTVRWHSYAEEVSRATPALQAVAEADGERWVELGK